MYKLTQKIGCLKLVVKYREWLKSDIQTVRTEFLDNGGDPNVSDAFLINGQPSDLYQFSRSGQFQG